MVGPVGFDRVEDGLVEDMVVAEVGIRATAVCVNDAAILASGEWVGSSLRLASCSNTL